eukprot:GAHX01001193.1.p1 GENE.GAHX01001193.1~~GAHX01001193.1.p1  ORF type:complete len:1039 (-),score=240.10 GAHX01001193.1:30-3098(-)
MDILVHQINKHSSIIDLYASTKLSQGHGSILAIQSSGAISILSSPSNNTSLQNSSTFTHPRRIVDSSIITFKSSRCTVILDDTKRLYLYTFENNNITATELSSNQVSVFLEYHSLTEIKLQTINDVVLLYSKESCQIYIINLLTKRQASLSLKNFKRIKEIIIYKEFDNVCLNIIAVKPSFKTLNKMKEQVTQLKYTVNGNSFTLRMQTEINKEEIYQVLKISETNNKSNLVNINEDELIHYKVKLQHSQTELNEIEKDYALFSFSNLCINTQITLKVTNFKKEDFIIMKTISLFNSSFILLLVSKNSQIYILNCKTNELKLLAKFKKIKSIMKMEENTIGIFIKGKGLFIFEITTNYTQSTNFNIKKDNRNKENINSFKLLKESILNTNNKSNFTYNFNLISLIDINKALITISNNNEKEQTLQLNTHSFYTSNDVYTQHNNTLYYTGSLVLKERDKEIQSEIKALTKKFPFINTSHKQASNVTKSLKITNLYSVTLKEGLILKLYKSGKIMLEENGNLVFKNVFDLPLSEKNIQTEEIESGDEADESMSDSMEDLNDFNINSVGVLFSKEGQSVFIFISSKFKFLLYSYHFTKRNFSLKCSIDTENSEIKQLEEENLGFFIRNKLLLFFCVNDDTVLINCPTDDLKKKINVLLGLKLKVEEGFEAPKTNYTAKGVQMVQTKIDNDFKNLSFKMKQSERVISMQNIKNKIMLINFFDKNNVRENTLLFSLNYKTHYSLLKIKIEGSLFVCSDIMRLFKCNSANFFFDNPNLENYNELKKTNYLVLSLTELNKENDPVTTPTKSKLCVFNLPTLLELIKPYLTNKDKNNKEIDFQTVKEISFDILQCEKLEFNYPIENVIAYDGFFVVSVNSILYLVGIDKLGKINIKSMLDLLNKIVKVVKVQNLLIVYLTSNVVQFVVFENKCFKGMVLDQVKIRGSRCVDMVLCSLRKEGYGLLIVDENKGTFIVINDSETITPTIVKTIVWSDKRAKRVYEMTNKKCIGGIVEFDNGSDELILYDAEV